MLFKSAVILGIFHLNFLNGQNFFVSPIDGSFYQIGSIVPVRISNLVGRSGSGTASQNCNGDILTVNVNIRTTYQFQIPAGYSGICEYTASIDTGNPPPVSINVQNSPFGGDLSPISSEQIQEFAQVVAFPQGQVL